MTTPPPDSAPTALVVDDNAEMRALIRGIVRGVGAEVHECASGEEAVAAYERIRPQYVLMDIRMEGIDGIEAMRRIRRSDPDAHVIVVTEHGEVAFRRAARAVGACGFVLKERLLELPELLESSPRDV